MEFLHPAGPHEFQTAGDEAGIDLHGVLAEYYAIDVEVKNAGGAGNSPCLNYDIEVQRFIDMPQS